MNPIRLAGPAVEPIPLAGMKAYLRLDHDEEDELVAALITAARLTVERLATVKVSEQTWRLMLAAWPQGRVVGLAAFYPVTEIAAIRVAADAAATPVPVAGTLYRLDRTTDPARLVIEPEVADPSRSGRIEIDVVCGYDTVPEPLLLAIRRLVAYWFEHRGDEAGGSPPPRVPSLPQDALALIAPFRRMRLA